VKQRPLPKLFDRDRRGTDVDEPIERRDIAKLDGAKDRGLRELVGLDTGVGTTRYQGIYILTCPISRGAMQSSPSLCVVGVEIFA